MLPVSQPIEGGARAMCQFGQPKQYSDFFSTKSPEEIFGEIKHWLENKLEGTVTFIIDTNEWLMQVKVLQTA